MPKEKLRWRTIKGTKKTESSSFKYINNHKKYRLSLSVTVRDIDLILKIN